jgi:hypothetical protein
MEIDGAKPDSFSAYNAAGGVPRSIAHARACEAGRASIIPSRYLRAEQASAEFGPLAQTYAASLMRSDPSADALIEALQRTHPGAWWSLVLTALNNGIASADDVPPELHAFIVALPPEPTASEWERIEQGGAAVARTRFSAGRALHCAALMVDYWSSAFSKPLEMTGQLLQRTAQRLLQTGAWWIQVHEPGGLLRERDGFKTTLHVRLIHASVRRMALASGAWDTAAWGVPINQGDLLFQVVGFSWLFLRSLERMGYRMSYDEKAAYYTFWRYLAALMGIERELLPLINEVECARFWELWLLTNPGPDDGSAELADASLRALTRMISNGTLGRRVQFPILCGTSRWLLGKEICDGLKIPRTIWSHVLPLTYRPVLQFSELISKLRKKDRSRVAVRSIAQLASRNAAAGVLPKGSGVVAAPEALEALARFKPPDNSMRA